MKTNELRPRNLISDGFFMYKVLEITSDIVKGFSTANGKDFYPDTLYSLNEENLKGIPLTEEWLLKFGFEQTDEGDGFKLLHFWISLGGNDKLYLRHYLMGGFIWGFNHFKELGQPISIEYVHQLQNLYFALTSEELKIKDDENNKTKL